jgi:hypothetical protein
MSTSGPLELLHIDLFGPITYKSIGENSYALVVVDDYSRYTCVFFLSDKSNVIMASISETIELKIIVMKKGVKHEFSVKYTLQQN